MAAGITLEGVEKYHRDTLKAVLERVNKAYAQMQQERRVEKARRDEEQRTHRAKVEGAAKRIKFD